MGELREGDVVASRYRVARELARGGMGVVYEATDLKFALQVALKVVAGPGTGSAAMRARFVREARLGALLGRTPGFVRVFDWGEHEDGAVYLALDLVPGAKELDLSNGSLAERLERFAAAARIVATLHRLGVIHRDLKPSNFLVAPDGSLHLTDFGLARAVTEPDEAAAPNAVDMRVTSTGTTMGTPHYMAPELFEDAKAADARADVFALGVMLFWTLTGRLPYDGDNPATVISGQMRVRYGQAQAPRARDHVDVPAAVDEVCALATALDPARRPADAAALLDALERAGWREATAPAPAKRPSAPDAATLVEGPPDEGTRTSRWKDRCHACGSEGTMKNDRCVRCGVPRGERVDSGRARAVAPAEPVRLRTEVGAGVDQGGLAVPKLVWFVAGALLVITLGLSAFPTKRGPDDRVSPAQLPAEHRRQLALFEQLHAAWLRRAEAPPADGAPLDPFTLAGAESETEARATFTSLTCTQQPSGTPVTLAETAEYSFERVGHRPPVIARRRR